MNICKTIVNENNIHSLVSYSKYTWGFFIFNASHAPNCVYRVHTTKYQILAGFYSTIKLFF